MAWIGIEGDPRLVMWFLGWTPHSLSHYETPFFSDYIHYPTGANMMWNVSLLAPATVLWPITDRFGVVTSYNALVTLGPSLSAWCMFLAARRYVQSSLAAWCGGLLYGFSPYILAQSLGHLHISLAMFPPLLLLVLDEILARQRWRSWFAGLVLGASGAAQLLTSEELLASTVMVTAIGVVIAAAVYRKDAIKNVGYTLTAGVWAMGTALVLSAFPMSYQFRGPLQVRGSLQPPSLFSNDLLTFVVPSDLMHFAPPEAVRLAHTFVGNNVEASSYFGIPLLLFLLGVAIVGRQSRLIQWASAFGVVTAVLSLGPVLHRAGHASHITPPWAVLWQLPIVENVIPARLALFCYIGAALLVAIGLELALHSGSRLRLAGTLAVLAAAFAAILPSLPYPSTAANIPPFFQPGGEAARIREGSVVLVTPYSNGGSSTAMLWQARAGYRFKMPEGEAYVPGPTLNPPPSALQTILVGFEQSTTSMPSAELRSQALQELRSWRVATVVVGPSIGEAAARQFFTDLLGQPPKESGGVAVWWQPLAVRTPT
ncbi:MAG: hypothetical protein JF888_04635 [Candidatus Dormibacteraeota bacterium]|uniref:Glycosyltransferase RgtA/B/C/D-like domain-containing protein n=1 Tax=Candidatus Dormiibacter inghamiae TaxID=3127013 RepID=A0A934KGZ0_9BACT|nr:hypothetical protein [Candidatus Dormibacteraeota bacterium]MBJ7605076.1 hypothetical protein [Candidatus Dormibacteraeota bacterium]